MRLENVFLERGMATASLDGPGQGESGYDLPIRPDYEVAVAALLDALDGRATSTSTASARSGSRWAATTRRGRAPSSRALKAVVGLSGPYNFAEIWDELPPLTRETFTAKSFSERRGGGAREGRRRST